jgi:hypothetical protein
MIVMPTDPNGKIGKIELPGAIKKLLSQQLQSVGPFEIEREGLTRKETASRYRAPIKGKAFILMACENLERSLTDSCAKTWTIWNTSGH